MGIYAKSARVLSVDHDLVTVPYGDKEAIHLDTHKSADSEHHPSSISLDRFESSVRKPQDALLAIMQQMQLKLLEIDSRLSSLSTLGETHRGGLVESRQSLFEQAKGWGVDTEISDLGIAPEDAYIELDSLIDTGISSGGSLYMERSEISKYSVRLSPEDSMRLRMKITMAINTGKVKSDFYDQFF